MTIRPTEAAPATTGRVAGPRRGRLSQAAIAYLFLLPTFVFLAYFLYYPAITAFRGAFALWDGVNPPEWIGLENFRQAFDDPDLRDAAVNNLIWMVGDVLLALLPAFLVAELIFHLRGKRSQYAYRTLFVFPLVIPGIVVILLWRVFYSGDGVLNQILGVFGAGPVGWLSNPDIALYSLIGIGFPWIRAFNLLIFYAGLQSISQEVLESAQLDGATGWTRVRTMDIPLIAPQFKLLFVLSVIGSVQNIVTPLVLTDGGPGTATLVPSLHMYKQAVEYGEYGYSMAIATILFVLVLGLTLFNLRMTRSSDT
jgi:ABC-type sugar transport system permease subunit